MSSLESCFWCVQLWVSLIFLRAKATTGRAQTAAWIASYQRMNLLNQNLLIRWMVYAWSTSYVIKQEPLRLVGMLDVAAHFYPGDLSSINSFSDEWNSVLGSSLNMFQPSRIKGPIGHYTDQELEPLVHCVRLLAASFLLTGQKNGEQLLRWL